MPSINRTKNGLSLIRINVHRKKDLRLFVCSP